MTHEAHYAMMNYLGSRPAESGGILFGFEDDYVIRKFIPDEFAFTTGSSYTMNTDFINSKIKELWENEKLSLLGIVHSHPNGSKVLSPPDRQYFLELMTYIGLEVFYTPIINTMADGLLDCRAYAFEKDSKEPVSTHLYIVPDDFKILDEVDHPAEEKGSIVINNTFYLLQNKDRQSTFLTDTHLMILIFLILLGLCYGGACYFFVSAVRAIF